MAQARLRPPLESEVASLGLERATKDGRRVLLGAEQRDAFDFDLVFGTESTNANIFHQGEVERWLRTVAQGYHGALVVAGEVCMRSSWYCSVHRPKFRDHPDESGDHHRHFQSKKAHC